MLGKYHISNRNYFKPGLGETTRMLIRRNPDFIIINEHYMNSLDHILLLCKIKNVKILIQNDMPVPCVGIINKFQS
jgi:ribosomal protein L7Ae-like RNA K-turn-binding protein